MSKDIAVLDEIMEDTLQAKEIIIPKAEIVTPQSIDLNPKLYQITEAQIKDLDKLEQLIQLYLLDYSNTPTSTHKGEKARFGLEWCVKNNIGVALFGNFGTELSSKSEGSGMDALEFFSDFYPDVQVIGFAPLEKGRTEAYITREKINPYLINGKEKIRIHIDCEKYLKPKRLEEIFRCCIKGKAEKSNDPLAKLYASEEAKGIAQHLNERRYNLNCKAITNIHEFAPGSKVYSYDGKMIDQLRDMDIIVSTIGSGERFLDQIISLGPTYNENKEIIGPVYITVTTYGNPLAGTPKIIKSKGYNRLDTPYTNPAHKEIKKFMKDPMYDIRILVVGEDEKTLSAGVATRIKSNVIGDLAISETGALGFAAILKKNCMTAKEYFENEKILENFPVTYQKYNKKYALIFPNFGKFGKISEGYKDHLVVPKTEQKHKICIVYTGSSTKSN